MRYYFSFLAPLLFVFSLTVNAQKGVPLELATMRAGELHNISYQLSFYIPAERDSAVTVSEVISFELAALRDLPIDFWKRGNDTTLVNVNGKDERENYAAEHILIPARLLKKGVNNIRLQFKESNPPALNRNTDFCYTLLVPDRARTLFPCFDQPDAKAVFHLTLTIPTQWRAMGNAPIKDSTTDERYKTLHFLPSDRISTYLFSFAAGRFSAAADTLDGRPMHFFYRETDSSKIRLSISPIFRIQADAIRFMEQYTRIPYPFKKFDFIAIPDFQFGGMEHPGAIQYKASALFLDSGATRDQIIARSNVLSHETAHMWFGDLVTMKWFNDVWMKEVFANFMADKISNITLPDGKYDLKFLTDHFPAAYSIDRTAGAHPIRQQLDNLQDAGSLYGNIIYHKAPIVMRQLERLMGETSFRDGLRDYLKRYAGSNATWSDLIHILRQHTSLDLDAWDRVWVNEAGRPSFTYSLDSADGRIKMLEIRQQGEDGSSRVWPQLFEIGLIYEDHVEQLTVNMNAAVVHVTEAAGKKAPIGILFNSSGQGYGVFPVSNVLVEKLPYLKDPVMRAAAYINLYENMLDGRSIGARRLLDFDRAALAVEGEELNLNILLEQLSSIYWRFIPAQARDTVASGLEEEIWQTMTASTSGNIKKQLFRTYSGIVLSREGVQRLYNVWKDQQPPAGVRLSEDDYTNLAAALALRGYPGQELILQEQLSRIQNVDRRQRLQFLMPALSKDTAERDAFFNALKDAAGRKKEAWVLTGLSYLHHPLRVGYSEKYLPQTLALLEEVQRTGDVFFPQSWLQTSLSWYRTRTAAAIVRDYLKANPNLNAKLKAKLLQAADNLFRFQ